MGPVDRSSGIMECWEHCSTRDAGQTTHQDESVEDQRLSFEDAGMLFVALLSTAVLAECLVKQDLIF